MHFDISCFAVFIEATAPKRYGGNTRMFPRARLIGGPFGLRIKENEVGADR
jgi:hypothetical protein